MSSEKRNSRAIVVSVQWYIQNNISYTVCTRVYNILPQHMSLSTFNLSATVRSTLSTRVQNNGSIYNLIFTVFNKNRKPKVSYLYNEYKMGMS